MYFGMIKPLPTRNLINISAAALILLGGFFAFPLFTSAELSLPVTPCDDEQVDAILPTYNVSAHLVPGMIKEPGNVAFQYGADNNSFVSKSGDIITFNVNLLFTPENLFATIKFLSFDASCNIIFGFAPTFDELSPDREKLITFDTATNLFTHAGEEQQVFPNFAPRYVWVEVVDQYPNANLKTYSYLVDILDPQNPSGQPDEGTRLIPDPVIIIPGILGSANKNGTWVIDPILHTYDNLIETLEANGYQQGYDLFTFPYNWYQSNILTAHELRNKIIDVKNSCACTKVDIVAHSMGGLVARQYIQSDEYEGGIDQLIFLGTPHLGSPNAYLMWEAGEFGTRILDSALEFVFSKEAKSRGYGTLFEYLRNQPVISVQQLLPTYDYLRDSDSGILISYPENSPRNVFLEELNDPSTMQELLSSAINITNIVENNGKGTLNTIRVVNSPNLPLWEHGYPEGYFENEGDRGLELGSGDGTVPLSSAEAINLNTNYFDSEHSDLVTDAESAVFRELTGTDANILVDKFQGVGIRLIFLKMLSPADMQVVAPDGKRAGKDFVSGGEYNEIENAFYSGFLTDDEYITILNPLDGEYQIITQGTGGGGEYTIAAGYITDEGTVEDEFVGQAASNEMNELTLILDSQNLGNLEINETGDALPPVTIPSPTGTVGLNGWYRSDVSLTLDATDDNSGVLKTEYSLDGGTTWLEYSAPIQITTLGINDVLFFSTDRAGNKEENQSIEIKIDKWAPDASFMFDPAARDVAFSGIYDQSDVVAQDLGNRVILTDEAGNTTVLNYKEKTKKQKSIELELASVSYNDKPKIKLRDNETTYSWTLDKSGSINRLEQELETKDNSISLSYSSKHDQTVVVKKIQRKKEKITLNGMIILKVKMMGGKIEYEY